MNWPDIKAEHRPWTRWWWLGSALSEAEITRHLTLFQAAGFGGVEVSPIYGAKGYEDRWVAYLSPRWVDLFAHTLREAKRLGLGVDLITGSGWPFGGPWVGSNEAAKNSWVEVFAPVQPVRSAKKPEAELLGQAVGADGTVYALFMSPTKQQVKRASPGGEGNVLDHFDAGAVRHYLEKFDTAFASLPPEFAPRCFFNDSWEVYGANSTPDILSEFQRRRGYDLLPQLPYLNGDGAAEIVRRVRADYRETMEDLAREAFLETWKVWAHRRGSRVRNQAHGSPGNLLDFYGAVDIPETEVFGPIRLKQGGLPRMTPDLPPDFGEEEEMLVCKMASSAAHIMGRKLCSSESFTWLGEHGHVSLEHMKLEVDTLLVLGINHIFFHGTPSSPGDVAWPGWLFYAATHVGPTNPFWRDLPVLNSYITRCQSLLQAGIPDNDILLYFPYYDLQSGTAGAQDLLQYLTVHRTKTWLRGNLPAFTATARRLWERGWTYDLVSDRQLADIVEWRGGAVTAGSGAQYRVMLISGCHSVPPETLERWIGLARAGATILVHGALPDTVPGLGAHAERTAKLRNLVEGLGSGMPEADGIHRYVVGNGRILTGLDVDALLTFASVPRETLADSGLEFIRRRIPESGERIYFVANPGKEDREEWFSLTAPMDTATLQDAMRGTVGRAKVRKSARGIAEIYLQIPAGGSLLVRIPASAPDGPSWFYEEVSPDRAALSLPGPWDITFIEGGPTLPSPRRLDALTDWSTWGETYRSFSGTARYSLSFDVPDKAADAWILHLGRVCDSARVRLNGVELGTVLARPWQLPVPASLLRASQNLLEIEVTNLMANRLAARERQDGDRWRPFLMVNIRYKPFDAAQWPPTPSGLLGPVQLVPIRKNI